MRQTLSRMRPHNQLVLAAALLVGSSIPVLIASRGEAPVSGSEIAIVLLAVLLLDVFDLLLPRGDRIGLDGPILAAAMVVAPPVAVFGIALVARATAMIIRRETSFEDWAVELATTASGVGAAALVVLLFRGFGFAVGNYALLLVALACAALLAAQVVVSQLFSARRMSRPFNGLLMGNLRFQGPLLVAEMSAAVLLALTYEQMGLWALVLTVVLLLLLRHSYALLISIRQTYMNTVEVLVDTAELSDPRRRGHSERTAGLARDIAEELGLSSRQVEQLSYAALLHDLDMVGLDPEDAATEALPSGRQAGRVLAKVGFLKDVVPLLRILDGDPEAVEVSTSEQKLLSLIVAVASDIDAEVHAVPIIDQGDVARVGGMVSASDKARVIGASIRLGHSVPAVP